MFPLMVIWESYKPPPVLCDPTTMFPLMVIWESYKPPPVLCDPTTMFPLMVIWESYKPPPVLCDPTTMFPLMVIWESYKPPPVLCDPTTMFPLMVIWESFDCTLFFCPVQSKTWPIPTPSPLSGPLIDLMPPPPPPPPPPNCHVDSCVADYNINAVKFLMHCTNILHFEAKIITHNWHVTTGYNIFLWRYNICIITKPFLLLCFLPLGR